MFNCIYGKSKNNISTRIFLFHTLVLQSLLSIHYLIINIGVSEWKIILRAILGLNKRAKTFRL